MSKYTTELRFICEREAGLDESKGYTDIDSIIQSAIPHIFNFNFEIFDESYRNVLCTKILRHYYTREICEETYGLWKLRLQAKLNEIMPYYNQLYNSQLLEFNPLYDVDLSTRHDGEKHDSGNTSFNETQRNTLGIEKDGSNSQTDTETKTDNGSANSTQTSNGTESNNKSTTGSAKQRYSDTPQGSLDNIENNTYLTNATLQDNTGSETDQKATSDSTTTQSQTANTMTDNVSRTGSFEEEESHTENRSRSNTGTNTLNSTEAYIVRVTGKTGGVTYSKMLQEFRKTFLNIDMEIIKELAPLFFGLW